MICLRIWHRFETSKASQLSKEEGHRELFCLCLVFFLELREFQLLSLSLGRSLCFHIPQVQTCTGHKKGHGW